jgi:AP2 domain
MLVKRVIRMSPYVKLEGYKEHIFRWGVGNNYELKNKIRHLPPYKPRPTRVTIPEEYFKSESPNIRFDFLNEQWEVFWWEYEKLNAKPFPVKKYGVELSKREAASYERKLKEERKMHMPPDYEEEINDQVFFDDRLQTWFATYTDETTGKRKCKGFSAIKWGFEQARTIAIKNTSE